MIADVADGKDFAESLARQHGANSVLSSVTDVSDEGAVKALVAKTMERFGKIDILVNNAALFAPLAGNRRHRDRHCAVGSRHGGQRARRLSDGQARRAAHDRAEIRQDHQYQFRHRRPRHPEFLALCDLEGRGDGVHARASRELGEHNICVNNLAPGFTLSDSVINENPQHLEKSRQPSIVRRALKRDEYPEDLLGALVFLASADSDFVTGQTIAVDGGATNN